MSTDPETPTPPPAENPTPEVAPQEPAPPAPAAPGAKPEGAEKKLVAGILAILLNGLGIYHYDQIAGWTSAETDWVDEHLSFKGRIAREDWIAQAKTLADGGETDFSSRSGTVASGGKALSDASAKKPTEEASNRESPVPKPPVAKNPDRESS